MTNFWFTSDTHFGHENILRFCAKTRPCASIEEHDRRIIANWQSVVQQNDVVYHLGDVGFSNEEKLIRVFNQLPGEKYLIWGNHDQVIKKSTRMQNFFTGIADYKEISIEKQRVVLFHYPIYEWNKMHHGSFHFYGHVHGSVGSEEIPGRAQDVGIDTRPAIDLSLWSWKELHAKLSKVEVRSHHGQTKASLRDAADLERYLNSRSQKV